jgi:hypothetical protein
MKGNRIPREKDLRLVLAGDLVKGLQRHAADVNIPADRETLLREQIAAYRTAEAAVGRAKQARQDADTALQQADDAAYAFLGKIKGALSITRGPRWNAGWEATGFPTGSTMIPKQQHVRWNLCASLQLYFANNPEKEIPALGATAAQAGEQHAAIRRASAALAVATTQLGQLLQVRDAAFEKLGLLVRSAMNALSFVLPDDDPRWHAFGLNPPADPHVPQRVESLALHQTGPGALEVRWGKAPRATRYRLYVQVLGKDPEPKARPPAYDTHVYLTGFVPGDTLRIFILAANATGEAAPSPTQEITLT